MKNAGVVQQLRQLIHAMASSNPSWGEEPIANELLLTLGFEYHLVQYWVTPDLPVARG